MVDLKAQYENAGLELDTTELPDFLPLFLEFVSTLPATEARDTLAQPAHIFAALAERLRKRNSAYEAVFRALVALRRRCRRPKRSSALLALPDPDANDLAALDAAWEDEAVQLRSRRQRRLQGRPDRACARRVAAGAGHAGARRAHVNEGRVMNELINYIVFGWYPYLCLTVFLLGSVLRFDREQYTWRSGSSQLLRRRQLIWGSNLFHVGILVIFLGHFVGLLTPIWIFDALGISHTFKQWLAIGVGGVAGVMCFVGTTLLVHRRLFDARIRTTSSFGDIAILLMLYAQLTLGLCTIYVSLQHLDGHVMVTFMTWAQGILLLRPDVSALILDVPLIFKLHLVARHDHLPAVPVHPPGARLERADLVSRPAWLSGGAHAAGRRGLTGGGAAMSCSVHVQFPAGKPVNVSVNGVAIARDAIQREMQHHAAAKPIAAWQQAARALVVRELLLQEARRLAIVAEPLSDDEGRRETDEEAVIRGLIEREVSVPEPDDETCRRYYERNRARFRSSDIYEASHILFSALSTDREAHAQARADAIGVLATLQENPAQLCHAGAILFALPVGRTGRQSRPDHHGADDAGIRKGAPRAYAGSDVRRAGRDALRLPHYPPRPHA